MAKTKKRKLNIVRTLVFVLIVYIIVCFGIFIYKEPVKHYEISGNVYLSDIDILKAGNLENYPPIISILKNKTSKKLKKLDLIRDVKISYGWNFVVKIKIEENTPILIDKVSNQVILSDGKRIENKDFVGLPILLNTTPKEILNILTKELSEVEDGIRYMINEIEYTPSYNKKGKIIDENRFLLSMNDQNMVYINAKNASRLNKYLDIISTNKIKYKGTLYLDGDEERYPFKYADKTTVPKEDDKKDEN